MRLTLSILAVLAVVVAVSGQSTPDRRARFLKLREQARNGDVDAQRILQASRRKRPRPQTGVQSVEPAPAPVSVPARTTLRRPERVEEEPTPAPVRATPVRSRFRPSSRTSAQSTPVRTTAQNTRTSSRTSPQRTRVPIRQRQRVVRPLTPFPEPTTTPAPTTIQEIVTAKPIVFITEAPVFETFAPIETFAPTEQPFTTQARFEPAPTQARFQPAPTQAPRVVIEDPVEAPISRIRTNSRGEQRVVADFEPHRALQNGLEVDQRSETFLGRVRTGVTTEAPVLTINRYSFFDDEGSYVFGYEAADGSFKEERRALNCIVYGKYGYVDPDGVRREFNYQSGNECDPNAVQDPNLIDELAPVNNDQFNVQTAERQLSDAELQEVNFNRRRRPQQPRKPVQESSPRVRPETRRPATRRPAPQLPAPQPEVFEQQFRAEVPEIQAQSTSDRFTTPSSLNPNHRFNQNVPSDNFVEDRKPKLIETQAHRQQQVFKPVPVRPSPQPQFTQAPVQTFVTARPTPKPVTFDFDREFENLFNHFGPVAGVTPRPAPRIPTPVQTTRVTQPQTFKPQTPTFRPITRPPPPPTTRPPPPPTTRHPPPPPTHQPTQQTEGAHQLVFDPSTGGFKTVRTNVHVQAKPPARPQHFQPITSKPLTTFTAATAAPRPRAPAPVGVPLIPQSATRSFNPLPAVPTSGLIIHNQGSSVSTDEFDKFFSQFNLKF